VQHARLLRAVRCVITLRKDARNHPGVLDMIGSNLASRRLVLSD